MIVVVDEDSTGGMIVCTTTSESVFVDTSVRLKGGCHPDLPKDCSVDYETAQVVEDCSVIRRGIEQGLLRTNPTALLTISDLTRVQHGFGISHLASAKVKAYAKKRGII